MSGRIRQTSIDRINMTLGDRIIRRITILVTHPVQGQIRDQIYDQTFEIIGPIANQIATRLKDVHPDKSPQ